MSVCQTALNVPVWSVATRSHILKLQFNAPNSVSVGALLQTSLGHWGSLQCFPDLDFRGVLLLREARGGEEAKKGKEGEGTKRGREGKGGRPFPLPPPSQFATLLGQVSPSRHPGLWVT